MARALRRRGGGCNWEELSACTKVIKRREAV